MFDRGLSCCKSEGLPAQPDFVAELQSSWKAPSIGASPRTELACSAGVEDYGLAAAPMVSPTFAMLAGATAKAGKDASHPNKRCRADDSHLQKAYQASALGSRLSCTNSLLLVYLEGLLQDIASSGLECEVPEML